MCCELRDTSLRHFKLFYLWLSNGLLQHYVVTHDTCSVCLCRGEDYSYRNQSMRVGVFGSPPPQGKVFKKVQCQIIQRLVRL